MLFRHYYNDPYIGPVDKRKFKRKKVKLLIIGQAGAGYNRHTTPIQEFVDLRKR